MADSPDDATWPSGFVRASAVHIVGDDGAEWDFDVVADPEWVACGPTVTLRFENGTWTVDLAG